MGGLLWILDPHTHTGTADRHVTRLTGRTSNRQCKAHLVSKLNMGMTLLPSFMATLRVVVVRQKAKNNSSSIFSSYVFTSLVLCQCSCRCGRCLLTYYHLLPTSFFVYDLHKPRKLRLTSEGIDALRLSPHKSQLVALPFCGKSVGIQHSITAFMPSAGQRTLKPRPARTPSSLCVTHLWQ